MKMTGKLGVAVIGTGWVSGEHIRAFTMNPQTEVVAIVATSLEKGKAKAEEYGLKDCTIYTDYDKALDHPGLDIVTICTPNNLHAEETIKAANAGKHILIEKPISLNWEDALAMKAAVDKAKIKTLVGYVLRWNPLFMTAKKLMDQGYLGKLFYAETDYIHRVTEGYPCYHWTCKKSVGGSSLLAGGCHAVDAMRWFMQDDVTEVTAYSTGCRTDLEFNGTLAMILKFKNGAVGKICSSYDAISPYIFNLHLFGDKGTLRNNKLYSPGYLEKQLDYMDIPVTTPDSGDVKHHPFPEEINHFVDSILGDRETIVNLNDAVKTEEIVLAADKSAAEGRPVKLPLS